MTDYDFEECLVSAAIVDQANQVFLLSDSSKIDHHSFYKICPLTLIDYVICDEDMPNEWKGKHLNMLLHWITAKGGVHQMKVDFHLPLEEGPYSLRWVDRTNQALNHFKPFNETPILGHGLKKAWNVYKRMETGAYDSSWLDLYLMEAKRNGLKEVGIVDHLYPFKETRTYFEKTLI